MTKTKKILFIVIIVLASFLTAEAYLRQQVWDANADDEDIWRMIFYTRGFESKEEPDHVIVHKPGMPLSFRLYGLHSNRLAAADIKLNNLGYISNRDYDYDRHGDEFRIVVLGGEQSASTVANHSWPDFLEDELNERSQGKTYKVFNLAWPDAGPAHYVKNWQEDGRKFNADLVIVNYVESDFYRSITGGPLAYHRHAISHREIEYRIGPAPDDAVVTVAPYVKGFPANSFRDSMVIPGRPYGFFASPAFLDDIDRVRTLQTTIVKDMISGALPAFGALTLRALGGQSPLIKVSVTRNFDPLPAQKEDLARMVDFGIENFGWLVNNIPNLILTHNFHYGELKQCFRFTSAMTREAPRIKVHDMRSRIPADIKDEEIRSWNMIPHMGEKWSDVGHKEYARMMADVVKEWQSNILKYDAVNNEPAEGGC